MMISKLEVVPYSLIPRAICVGRFRATDAIACVSVVINKSKCTRTHIANCVTPSWHLTNPASGLEDWLGVLLRLTPQRRDGIAKKTYCEHNPPLH